MRTAVALTILLITALFSLVGCANKQAIVYQRQIQIEELAPDVAPVDNAFRLLTDEATRGRFGCGLAIAKLLPGEASGSVHLVAATLAEEGYWVSALCGVSEVRDLEFLTPINVRPDEPTTESLCAAAAALNADLLLMYAPNRYGPNSAQVLGVLYDVHGCQPLAVLHASATYLDEEGVETPPDNEWGNQRAVDACYQASRAYERHLLCCLRDLIEKDEPLPVQPHHWDTPAQERWWLRRGKGGG